MTDETSNVDDKVADAIRHSWVYRLPKNVWPYAQLARWERPIGWQLLMWPCMWSVMLAAIHQQTQSPSFWQLVFLYLFPMFLGAFMMRGAGCTFNDITDEDIDAQVERTRSRPLPSGRVSKKQAWSFLAAQSFLGLAILLFLSRNSSFVFLLGAASLVLIIIYPFMKRITWWPQLFLGLAFSWGALLGWASVTGSLSLSPVLMYLGSILWVIGYDTIYAHQDREDDALVGVKSTARLFGTKSKQAIAALYCGAIVLFGLSVLLALPRTMMGYWPILVGLLAGAGHLAWQVRTLDTNNAYQCLRLFKSNHHFGAILFAGLLVAWLLTN